MKNMNLKLKYYLALAVTAFVFISCNQWDEHIKVIDQHRNLTAMELISSNPETTKFAEILKKTGYDGLLSTDKLITVFAPVNSALQSVDMNNVDELTKLVKNHIAYLSYTTSGSSFIAEYAVMINDKRIPFEGLAVGEIPLVGGDQNSNIVVNNGVVHLMQGVIDTRLNIWDYLQTQSGNEHVSFIKSLDKLTMDNQKSVQIGVNAEGQPLYDTVWVNSNPLLEEYPLHDESKNYTYILLDAATISKIESKYAKYFKRIDQNQQDSIVRSELIKDCVLEPVEISADGRFASLGDVLIDLKKNDITETYNASNGIVYKVSDADVKIYENKLKTIIIEAEDYSSLYPNADVWSKRYRSGASGGADMMLNAQTNHVVYYQNENDSTISITFTYHGFPEQNINLRGGTAQFLSEVSNCYIAFNPTLHSVGYEMFWTMHDDIPWHSDGSYTRDNENWTPARFSQKLLVSFPDSLKLSRQPNAQIMNHFSANTVFSSTRFEAGYRQEKQLFRYLTSTVAADEGLYLLSKNPDYTTDEEYYNLYQDSDKFGDNQTLISPTYGEATLWVANTTEYKNVQCGMIFLDYIKLVPQVDINE